MQIADRAEMEKTDNFGPLEWKRYIHEASGSAVEAIIETGRRLKGAHLSYMAYPDRWEGIDWETWCRKELGYTKSALSQLETCGEFSIAKLFRHVLPADWTSLYHLAKWERDCPGSVEQAVKSRKLFASIKRNQVMELCGASSRAVRDKRNAELELQLAGQEWNLAVADFREWNPGAPVDLVLTDPPYAKEHLELYEDLPTYANEWLAPNGWLAVLTGQGNLPAFVAALAGGPLTYVWTFALTQSASRTTAIHPVKIQNVWKPLILLRKGKLNLEEWTLDHISYDWTPKDGDRHKWQQEISPLQKLIRAMTKVGELVADPFCGSGTTGLAALSTSRRFVGCDTDELSIKAAGDRLSQPLPDRPEGENVVALEPTKRLKRGS